MKFDLTKLNTLLTDYVLPFMGICAWLILGIWMSSFLSRLLYAGLSHTVGIQKARTFSKTFKVLLIGLFVLSLIKGAGVDITAVLGAAGVAGVAIGFASQTSLANLISGMFLVLERPFKIGDWIEVDGSFGAVHSIEWLSTYIRMPDNRVVRVPNEVLSKSKLINFTQYPLRRIDLEIGVSCRENAERVAQVLREVIIANPNCFNEPEPLVVLRGFSPNAMDFFVAVWADRKEHLAVRSSLATDIKMRFDREGIELPYQRIYLNNDGDGKTGAVKGQQDYAG